MKHITLGFSIHRPEMISITAGLMRRHEAIILEEPPQPGFRQMLQGKLEIDDYLMPIDDEYPEFSRRMCRLVRQFFAEGKKILQVEPFLQNLLVIHERFAKGHRPEELRPQTVQHQVYLAERKATGALLNYYQTVMSGSFEAALQAIKRFARCYAARFRLRESLRARALVDLIIQHRSAFIEAGSIHYLLYPLLRQQLPRGVQLKPVFLARKALQSLGRNGHLYGPGDQLTLFYVFHPNMSGSEQEALLAARSLIYTKLIEKEEVSSNLNTYPHVNNELACIRSVNLLNLSDCGRLFPLIRHAKTARARQLVDDYLARFKKNPGPRINTL